MRLLNEPRFKLWQSAAVIGLTLNISAALADDKEKPSNPAKDESKDVASDGTSDLAQRRLKVMKTRVQDISFTSPDTEFPKHLHPTPVFRYEDQPRGYVDGTVWRLGEQGRPLALITSELHPNYLNSGSRIVYDFLSLTARPFTAKSSDVP